MRRSRPVFRLLALAVVVSTALAGATLLWLTHTDGGHAWLLARLTALAGPNVHFADARVTPWPPPLVLSLDAVELRTPDGGVVAGAAHVHLRLRLGALLAGRVVLSDVGIDGLQATVSRAADGAVSLGARRLDGAGSGGAAVALPVPLPRLELRDAALALRDDSGAAPRTLALTDLDATLEPHDAAAHLTLSARSDALGTLRASGEIGDLAAGAGATLHLAVEADDAAGAAAMLRAALAPQLPAVPLDAPLRLVLTFDGSPAAGDVRLVSELASGSVPWDTFTVQAPVALHLQGRWREGGLEPTAGTVAVAHVRAKRLVATDVRATLAWADGTPSVRGVRWHALGGNWIQHGRVTLSDPPQLDGGVQAEGVDGAALAEAARGLLSPAAGPLHLEGPVRLAFAGRGTLGAAFTGHVDATLASGSATWAAARLGAPLAFSAEVAAHGTQVQVANAQVRAATAGYAEIEASELAMRGGVANQVLQIASCTARVFDGTLAASGEIPLASDNCATDAQTSPPASRRPAPSRGRPSVAQPAGRATGPAIARANARAPARGGACAPTGRITLTGVNAARLAHAALTGNAAAEGAAGAVDLSATLDARGSGTLTLRLASPALTLGDLRIDAPASASAAVAWQGGAPRLTGGIARLGTLGYDGVTARNVNTAFASAPGGGLRIGPLTATAMDGAWTVDATVSRQRIDATLKTRRVDFDEMLAAMADGPESPDAVSAVASLQLTLSRPRGGASTATGEVTLHSGRFLYDELSVDGPARAAGALRVDGTRLTLSGIDASAAAAAYPPLRGRAATARFDFGDARLRFADLRLAAYGGQWQYAGDIGLAAPWPISGTLTASGADPRQVLTMVGMNPATLDIPSMDLRGQFTGVLAGDWRQALRGDGSLALHGGSIVSTALLRSILAGLLPGHHFAARLDQPNRLTSLTESFTVADAGMRTSDLRVVSQDYSFSGAGRIGFDGSLDLAGPVTLTAHGMQKMFALSALRLPTGDLPPLPPIPAHFGGTLAHPSVRPDLTALPGATARWFVDALIGVPRSIGEAIGRPVGRFLDELRGMVTSTPPTPPPN